MTRIGAKLLELLTDRPDDWRYTPVSDGMTHTESFVTLVPGAASTVIVLTGATVRSGVLDTEDHDALYPVVARLVDDYKTREAERNAAELLYLLGLEKT